MTMTSASVFTPTAYVVRDDGSARLGWAGEHRRGRTRPLDRAYGRDPRPWRPPRCASGGWDLLGEARRRHGRLGRDRPARHHRAWPHRRGAAVVAAHHASRHGARRRSGAWHRPGGLRFIRIRRRWRLRRRADRAALRGGTPRRPLFPPVSYTHLT